MTDSEELSDDRNALPFSAGGIVALVLGAVAVVYFSASLTLFLSVPAEERSPSLLLFPFDTGPTAEKLHERGVEAFRSESYREAGEHFSRSLRKQAKNPKGFFLLASSWAKRGKFERALESLRPLEGMDVDFPRLHVRKAYWLLGLGRYDEARASAERFVGDSSVPAANRLYGYLILYATGLMGEDDRAVRAALEEARSLELPEDSWPRTLLESLASGSTPRGMDRGERTEFRAWRALRYASEGRRDEAREDRRWVLESGVESRYEHDLMLATEASGLF